MEFVYLFAGVLIGAIFTWFLSKYITKTDDLQKINSLEKELSSERQLRISAETRLEEKSRAWEEAGKALKETFDSTAAAALKNNNQTFMDLARETLDNYINQAKGDFSRKQEAIEHILKPFKETMEKQEYLTRTLENSTKETFGSMKNYLEQLRLSQETLTKETSSLVSALKSPRVRGRWGEIGLRRIVEFSGMSQYCDFTEQQSVNTEDGRLRPDMIVRLPENRCVIVDSKVPLNAYLESIENEEENLRNQLLTKHARDVRDHMNKLGSKNYWSQFDNSVDFVVLYTEIESAFGAALSIDKNLILDGINNRVIFATPTTLITLLRTIAFSWKQQEITENAHHIWETGKELYDRVCVFAEHLGGIGKGLEGAVKSYNSAIGSWESRVMPSAKKLKELGATSDKKELNGLEEIELTTRELKKEEE